VGVAVPEGFWSEPEQRWEIEISVAMMPGRSRRRNPSVTGRASMSHQGMPEYQDMCRNGPPGYGSLEHPFRHGNPEPAAVKWQHTLCSQQTQIPNVHSHPDTRHNPTRLLDRLTGKSED